MLPRTGSQHCAKLDKDEYIALHRRLVRAFDDDDDDTNDLSDEDQRQSEDRDWREDSKGGDGLRRNDLYDAIFELADNWTDTAEADEYVAFLSMLYGKVFGRFRRTAWKAKFLTAFDLHKHIDETHWTGHLGQFGSVSKPIFCKNTRTDNGSGAFGVHAVARPTRYVAGGDLRGGGGGYGGGGGGCGGGMSGSAMLARVHGAGASVYGARSAGDVVDHFCSGTSGGDSGGNVGGTDNGGSGTEVGSGFGHTQASSNISSGTALPRGIWPGARKNKRGQLVLFRPRDPPSDPTRQALRGRPLHETNARRAARPIRTRTA